MLKIFRINVPVGERSVVCVAVATHSHVNQLRPLIGELLFATW
jgi:hypothetical protein